jgi:hypothetical protein
MLLAFEKASLELGRFLASQNGVSIRKLAH